MTHYSCGVEFSNSGRDGIFICISRITIKIINQFGHPYNQRVPLFYHDQQTRVVLVAAPIRTQDLKYRMFTKSVLSAQKTVLPSRHLENVVQHATVAALALILFPILALLEAQILAPILAQMVNLILPMGSPLLRVYKAGQKHAAR